MDEMPDYSLYSLNQLLDITAHVNREKFPERFAAVQREIEMRQSQPQIQSASIKNNKNALLIGIVGGINLGFVSFCLSASGATNNLVDGIQPDYWSCFLLSVIFGAISGFFISIIVRRFSRPESQ